MKKLGRNFRFFNTRSKCASKKLESFSSFMGPVSPMITVDRSFRIKEPFSNPTFISLLVSNSRSSFWGFKAWELKTEETGQIPNLFPANSFLPRLVFDPTRFFTPTRFLLKILESRRKSMKFFEISKYLNF